MAIGKNKKFLLLLLFLNLLRIFCFSQSFEELYEKGLKLYKENNYFEAEIYLREALKFGVKKDTIHFLIGMCFAFQNKLEEAENNFLISLKLNNSFEESYIELGGLYFKKKEYQKAEQTIKKAIKINPENKYSHDFLGTLYYINGLTYLTLYEWNKINKPILENLLIESENFSKKEFLVKELCFNPGQIIKPSMLRESLERLGRIGNISNISFSIIPKKENNDNYNLQFSSYEEKGFGKNFVFFFITLLKDISQKMLHLDYKNISDININAYSTYSFDKFRKKYQLLLSFPRFLKLPFYFSVDYTQRNELWNLHNFIPDQAKVERWIKTKEFTLKFDYIHNDKISYFHYLKLKIRDMRNDFYSSENERALFSPLVKNILKYGGEFKFNLIYDLPRNFNSDFLLGYEILSEKNGIDSNFIKLLLTLENVKFWRRNLSEVVTSSLLWRLKLGYSSQRIPLEEKFNLGIGPDTNHYLRAHRSTYRGKRGNSPVVDKFILSNLQYSHYLFNLFPLRVEAGIFIDFANLYGKKFINYNDKFIIDFGVFAKFYLFKFPFILSFGQNFKENINCLYFSSDLKF
jgi:tetratricopeptide (TPR) repeat protein